MSDTYTLEQYYDLYELGYVAIIEDGEVMDITREE